MTLTGHELPTPLDPGSPEWLTKMSASKIAAVMGTSPYESRFSLWHRMAGNAQPQAQNDAMSIGIYMEPMIAQWFADQHHGCEVRATGTWQHSIRTWQIASPDRRLSGETFLECKFSQYEDEWTDIRIPAGYYDQVQWQCDVTGAEGIWVAVYFGMSMRFHEYWIRRNERRIAQLREAALGFLDSLPTGTTPCPPDVDAHTETYVVIREMNPDIDGDIEIDVDLVREFVDAKGAVKDAKKAEQLAVNKIADAMGTHRRALCNGEVIATRIAGRGENGKPSVRAARQTKKAA